MAGGRVRSKTGHELELMARAGHIVATVLESLRPKIEPGVATEDLDSIAEAIIRNMGALPSFKGYHGFPATICASVNEQVVHGIPGARALAEGDIVSIDVGTIWEGYQGDAAITVAVGEPEDGAGELMQATRAALCAGIRAARDGARLGDISHAIEATATERGFYVIREYGGHGIGREMHEPPRVPNWGEAGRGLKLRTGMTICLEPMLSIGSNDTRVLDDRWTVVTSDGSLSAHSEHTIVVTPEGGKILTQIDPDL